MMRYKFITIVWFCCLLLGSVGLWAQNIILQKGDDNNTPISLQVDVKINGQKLQFKKEKNHHVCKLDYKLLKEKRELEIGCGSIHIGSDSDAKNGGLILSFPKNNASPIDIEGIIRDEKKDLHLLPKTFYKKGFNPNPGRNAEPRGNFKKTHKIINYTIDSTVITNQTFTLTISWKYVKKANADKIMGGNNGKKEYSGEYSLKFKIINAPHTTIPTSPSPTKKDTLNELKDSISTNCTGNYQECLEDCEKYLSLGGDSSYTEPFMQKMAKRKIAKEQLDSILIITPLDVRQGSLIAFNEKYKLYNELKNIRAISTQNIEKRNKEIDAINKRIEDFKEDFKTLDDKAKDLSTNNVDLLIAQLDTLRDKHQSIIGLNVNFEDRLNVLESKFSKFDSEFEELRKEGSQTYYNTYGKGGKYYIKAVIELYFQTKNNAIISEETKGIIKIKTNYSIAKYERIWNTEGTLRGNDIDSFKLNKISESEYHLTYPKDEEKELDVVIAFVDKPNEKIVIDINTTLKEVKGKLPLSQNKDSINYHASGGNGKYALVIYDKTESNILKRINLQGASGHIAIGYLDLNAGVYKLRLSDQRGMLSRESAIVISISPTGIPLLYILLAILLLFIVVVALFFFFRKIKSPRPIFQESPRANVATKHFLVELNSKDNYASLTLGEVWNDSLIQSILVHKKCFSVLDNFINEQSRTAELKNEMIPEVGGYLLGRYHQDNETKKYSISLEQFVPVEPEQNGVYQIEFGAKAAIALDQAMQEAANLSLIGWFHTHPGHGLFLSGPDLNIHNGFFTKPYQIAMELDSVVGASNPTMAYAFFSRTSQNQEGTFIKEVNNDHRSNKDWYQWEQLKELFQTLNKDNENKKNK